MAGLRTASDERLFMGGIVIAVWIAGLVGVGLLFSIGERRAAAPAAVTAPPPVPTPAETLPPTVVVAGRADVYSAECGRAGERGSVERRCAAASPWRDIPAEQPHPEPARTAPRARQP
jgi:hypothetical protein